MVRLCLLLWLLCFTCCHSQKPSLAHLARSAGKEAVSLDFDQVRDINVFIRSSTYNNLMHYYEFQLRLSWSDRRGSGYWMDGILRADEKGRMLIWQEEKISRNLQEYRRQMEPE